MWVVYFVDAEGGWRDVRRLPLSGITPLRGSECEWLVPRFTFEET